MKIPVYKTEGIIIGRYNSNEFDKFLIVYTKGRGKILVKAKSLRKREAKLKETLELFNHVHLMLAKGRNIDTVTGAIIINNFPKARNSLLALVAFYYISELIEKLIIAPEKDEKVWQLILKAFYFLEEKKHCSNLVKKLLNRFEYNLISHLGFQPIKQEKSYLDIIQKICGEKIQSQDFLSKAFAS